MLSERRCSQCGAPLPANAPGDRCPKCLLQLALEDSRDAELLEKTAKPRESDVLLERTGMMVGRYQLLQQIGEGGFGVVFMAEQTEPVRRKVALKVIKAGMDTREVIARFEAERQALALMDHPNIAQVLDGGTTASGRPYFVMELVRGVPVTDYCDQASLSTRERLELFVKVCRAVQHAHQKGVIHRDLKPSNVLVTLHDGEPVPKVIDFGVAKALGQKLTEKTLFTRFEQMIGTPAYMSPEQAALGGLDIDTRSDIYSMGVLLYELLTGVTPLNEEALRQGALDEIRRMIRETDPPKPSTRLLALGERLAEVAKRRHAEPAALSRLVRGDLDWITMKALEKDRQRRYETVNGLAMDIERHLHNEPVVARPPSRLYEFQKTVRRHKVGFAAAAGLIAVLAGGVLVSTWQAVRATYAEREQKRLRGETEKAHADEVIQRGRAERSAAESRSRLVRNYLANGNRLVDEGNYFAALPWFAEALKLEQGDAASADIHGLRLASAIQQCAKLTQLWFLAGKANSAQFTPDGSGITTMSDTGAARVWSVATGQAITAWLEPTGGVRQAALSLDGRRLATVCDDQQVRVWDIVAGQLIAALEHTNPVARVRFSHDGRWIATMTQRSVWIWNATNGVALNAPLSHDGNVTCLEFSPDDRYLVTASSDSVARVWDATSGKAITPPLRHAREISGVAFGYEGRVMTISGATAHLWAVATGREVGSLRHRGQVNRAIFSPDGRWIATAGDDFTARLWDAVSLEPVLAPLQHKDEVKDAMFSKDGRWLTTVSADRSVSVWDLDLGEPVIAAILHPNRVAMACFSPDAGQILTTCDDGVVRIWDLSGSGQTLQRRTMYRFIPAASFSPEGRYVLAVSVNATAGFAYGLAQVWDGGTGEPLSPFPTNLVFLRDAQFSPDGRFLALAGGDGTASICEVASGRPVSPTLQRTGAVNHVDFSPDGTRLATASADGFARVWEIASGKLISEMRHAGPVYRAAFSPDGRQLLTATINQKFRFRARMLWRPDPRVGLQAREAQAQLWNVETGEPTTAPLKFPFPVTDIAFSSDRRRVVPTSIAAADSAAQTRVWDVVSGQAVTPPLRHEKDRLISASFSRDGRRLVTTGNDYTARVWDVATGRPLVPALVHQAPVHYASFSGDGRFLVTASSDKTARVWDSTTGEAVTPPLKHAAEVLRADFSPDDQRVLTVTSEAMIRVWRLPMERRPVESRLQLAQLMSGYQLEPAGHTAPLPSETLQALWQTLRPQYPGDFTTRPDQLLAWQTNRAMLQALEHKYLGRELADSEKWTNAIAEWSKVLTLDPTDWTIYGWRAHAYSEARQFEKAIADVEEELKWLPPADLKVRGHSYTTRGLWFLQLGRFEEAQADYQKALELDPEDVVALDSLAWLYVVGPAPLRSPEKALPLSQRAVELSERKDRAALTTLGITYYRMGELTKARQTFEESVKVSPEGGTGMEYFFLAMICQKLGDAIQARDYYTQATNWVATVADFGPAEDRELKAFRAEAEDVLGGKSPLK